MNSLPRAELAGARLYLVCDALPDERLHAALRGGVGLVQLRMKAAPDEQILATAERFRAVCSVYAVPLLLNDRPDLAVRAGADGVHVGQDDLSVTDARAILGPERIVGLSTHTPDQIEAARGLPVDYIGVGPIHATPTKAGRPAVGTALVAYAARRARGTFFAIGGIDPSNVGDVVAAGARRIAVVRAIADAADAELAARELRTALDLEVSVGAA